MDKEQFEKELLLQMIVKIHMVGEHNHYSMAHLPQMKKDAKNLTEEVYDTKR